MIASSRGAVGITGSRNSIRGAPLSSSSTCRNCSAPPGAPAEVAGSRDIVEPINKLTGELRKIGVPVIWVLHANSQTGGRSDWELFFNYIVADDVREKTKQSLAPGRQQVWSGLTVDRGRHQGHQEPL